MRVRVRVRVRVKVRFRIRKKLVGDRAAKARLRVVKIFESTFADNY